MSPCGTTVICQSLLIKLHCGTQNFKTEQISVEEVNKMLRRGSGLPWTHHPSYEFLFLLEASFWPHQFLGMGLPLGLFHKSVDFSSTRTMLNPPGCRVPPGS